MPDCAGRYTGEGINHDPQRFLGDLNLTPLLGTRGLSLQFTATGMDGEVYHQESTTIALGSDEKPKLWTINTNTTGQMELSLRRSTAEGGASETFVFGIGEIANKTAFREEIDQRCAELGRHDDVLAGADDRDVRGHGVVRREAPAGLARRLTLAPRGRRLGP